MDQSSRLLCVEKVMDAGILYIENEVFQINFQPFNFGGNTVEVYAQRVHNYLSSVW